MASSIPVGKRCTTVVTGTAGRARCSRTSRSNDGCTTTTARSTAPAKSASRRSIIGMPPTGTSSFGRSAAQARAEAGRGNDEQARAHLRGRSAVADSDGIRKCRRVRRTRREAVRHQGRERAHPLDGAGTLHAIGRERDESDRNLQDFRLSPQQARRARRGWRSCARDRRADRTRRRPGSPARPTACR